jgi:hypothetical protein
MSRNLPPHPNLDYLKKQAKELLHDMMQRNPALRLADAQHAIAREYGFASWPKLKVHVQSLSGSAETAAGSHAASDVERVNTAGGPPATDPRFRGTPEQASPFVGRWSANLSKSRRHPDNQFRSATLQINVVGDTVTIADVVVDDSGHENHGQNAILVDGNENRFAHGDGYVLMARWRGSHIIETVATKEGQAAGWGTYEVSADGHTLTVSGEQQVIVLDRVLVVAGSEAV